MEILVTGFPKSGNTWLSRLLGEILHCPVTGWKNAKPLATEGLDRESPHVVRQLHLWPHYGDCPEALPDARTFCIRQWDPEQTQVVHVLRDPRDVAVSCRHYWEIPTITEAIHAMGQRLWPLHHGPWQDFVQAWLRVLEADQIYYEQLHLEPIEALQELLSGWGLPQPEARIVEAIERQAFAAKRAQIEVDGNGRPHGRKIQLKNLRAGRIGDWEQEFSDWDRWLSEWYSGLMPLDMEQMFADRFMQPFVDKWQNPRMLKARALYRLARAQRRKSGWSAVELGVEHGCGSIAMALGGLYVVGVDAYHRYTSWAGHPMGPENKDLLDANLEATGCSPRFALIQAMSDQAVDIWKQSPRAGAIGLLHWDLAIDDQLPRDFAQWGPMVSPGGIFAIHDTWPEARFGAERLVSEMDRTPAWRRGPTFPVAGIWTMVRQ